jgi:hypothetical protein
MHRQALALLLLLLASAASAHVKWFEAYEVAAEPVPVTVTLALPHFWMGALLVLFFFVATTLLERRAPGLAVTRGLDWATRPLREHADGFMIAVLASPPAASGAASIITGARAPPPLPRRAPPRP